MKWYDAHRRDLPWRVAPGTRPDPYHILLSETMLQQTQVATMVPYFHRFLAAMPTINDLADADEQVVLRLWQGLGYYSRARNLRSAARRIVAEYGGQIPSDVESLRSLPGIGRYTAGAIASIAFDTVAPIVDGNVARVVCRIDRIDTDPRERAAQKLLWARAESLVPRKRAGDFNSALMELGSTVCTPRSPNCLICPVRAHCEAYSAGEQDRIPLPRRSKPTPLELRDVFAIEAFDSSAGPSRWLVEQRPAKGRWAGMWQFVTVRRSREKPTRKSIGSLCNASIGAFEKIGEVEHALTHRRYHFDVYRGAVEQKCKPDDPFPNRRWVSLAELDTLPTPRPHLQIAKFLDPEANGPTAASGSRRET